MSHILRIYEGNAGTDYKGSGSLLYAISGDLLSVNYEDLSNYEIDLFSARIARGNYDIDINDVWRLYDDEGVLFGSGPIEKEPITDTAGNLVISGTGWTGILKRRLVDTESYSAQKGDVIFKDILSTYFADYNINTDSVAAPTNTLTNNYDRESVYAIMREISTQSYGGSDRQFDFYLYEAAAGTIKAVFFQRGSGTAVNILPGDVAPNGFNLAKRGDLNYNYIYVKGSKSKKDETPSDEDYWTDQASIGDYWGTGNGTITADNSIEDEGTYCVKNSVSGVGDSEIILNFEHADAYVSSATTPYFTSESGYQAQGDQKDQYIFFKIRANKTVDAVFRIKFGKVGGSHFTRRFITIGDEWATFEFNLFDLAGGRWDEVETISWIIPDAKADIIYYMDHIHFYLLKRHSGVYDGSVAPRRDYPFQDDGLETTTECTNVATFLGKEFAATTYEGTLKLVEDNTSLRAGGILNILYPHLDIDLSGIPIQKILWTLNDQILFVGRHRSLAEILSDTKSKIDRGVY